MTSAEKQRLSTGVPALDEVLKGGLLPQRAYLLRGGPGTGKTTLGTHFLTQGHQQGEAVLLISFGESEKQIRRNAQYCDQDLSKIEVLDLSPKQEFFTEQLSYDLFSPADVELDPITRDIIDAVDRIQPSRVFVDSVTQLRYLATDSFQFHKQALSFIRYLTERGATVILTSESSASAPDEDLQFLSDGVIHLQYRSEERSIEITKFRGSGFVSGEHTVRLTQEGMKVYPKLNVQSRDRDFAMETLSTGIPEFDELLGGGIERGTTTIVTGPTGVGKTTFGMMLMKEGAGRGERSVVYSFEEMTEALYHRCESMNIPVRVMVKQGNLQIREIEALDYGADEFAQIVRRDVEENGTRIVMIDSVAGYQQSIRRGDVVKHLHALCRYLQNRGVAVLLINEVETITGDFRATEAGISYLADNIIFIRHLEIRGELRKAIGVLKKRLSDYEHTLREFQMTRYGIKVGRPLSGLRNILSGTPDWQGSDDAPL